MRFLFNRLDRYILRELVPPFVVATLLVLTMFQVNLYIYLGKTFDLSHVPFPAVMKLILYKSPEFLNLTFPIGVALSTSIAMSRIARESELTALKAAGIRVLRVMRPVALFGIAVGFLNLYTVDTLTPKASKAATRLQVSIGVLGSAASFQANLPMRLKQYNVSLGGVTRNPDDSLDIRDVLLIERPQAGRVMITSAPTGDYRGGVWTFHGATIWTTDVGSGDLLAVTTRDDVVVNERIVVEDLFNPGAPNEASLAELRAKIEGGRALGQDVRPYEVEYHVKLSVPVMCLIFALVCPIFSIALAKQGGFIGVLVSLVIVMLYYNMWVVSTQILSKVAWIAPWQSAWIPNALLAALGFYGLRRLE